MVVTSEPELFIDRADLDRLIAALRQDGREVIGPTVRDGAVMLDQIDDASELPIGWTAESQPGAVRLLRTDSSRVFDQPPGPSSWKRWTFPPRITQMAWAEGKDATTEPVEPRPSAKAFLGGARL